MIQTNSRIAACLAIVTVFHTVDLLDSTCFGETLAKEHRSQNVKRSRRPSPSNDPDIWLINTRHLVRPSGQTVWSGVPEVWQFRDGGYRFSTLNQLIETHDPSRLLCVYVHGNRQSPDDASGQGLIMYERFVPSDNPCRFVVWSWPSNEVRGLPFRDAQRKAARADGEAFFLASFLSRLPAESPVSLIGYSYGARTVSGSLHLLAGGTVARNRLPATTSERVHPRAAFLAAAFPRHWLIPNQPHGLAIQHSPQIVSFYNRRDPALSHFDFVFRNQGRPQALGYTGLAPHSLGAFRDRLIQMDATNIAGRSHSLSRLTDSDRVLRLIQNRIMY